jgi:hypothetical protein
VYDHTRIASYQHWGASSAGQLRVRLLALDCRGAELAGGLSSDPILSGLRQTKVVNSDTVAAENVPASREKSRNQRLANLPTCYYKYVVEAL